MRTQSIDTSPEFERIQIARIRAFSAAKKFTSVRSWTQSITSANLHSADSSSDDTLECNRAVAFVAREYGDNLAHLFFNAIEKQPGWRLQTPDIQEALLPILDVAPDHFHKKNVSGGAPYEIHLPNMAADASLLNEPHGTTFVHYLRLCCTAADHPLEFTNLAVSHVLQPGIKPFPLAVTKHAHEVLRQSIHRIGCATRLADSCEFSGSSAD